MKASCKKAKNKNERDFCDFSENKELSQAGEGTEKKWL